MTLTMRPIAVDRDASLIVAYARDLFAISFGSGRFEAQFGSDGAAYLPWIAAKQVADPANAALALLDGRSVGMVVVGPWPGDAAIGYVHHYYLEPGARGRGLAAELDGYAAAALRRAGYFAARLSVARSNERALRFYRKRGWIEAGPRPDQPGILYMERTLEGPGGARRAVPHCSATPFLSR